MDKLTSFFLIVCVAGLISSCVDKNGTSLATTYEGATYTGIIPCADCKGIAYKLTLKKNNRFETASVYIGKSNRAYIERGTWSTRGDSLLILNGSEENARQFKLKNDQLMMLDSKGKENTGSLSKMYVLHTEDSTITDRKWTEQRKQGIDFRASGSEPFWAMGIDFDRKIEFQTANGDSISLPVPAMTQDTTSKARVWNAKAKTGSLKVALYPTGCVDDGSGQVYNYFVHVKYDDKTYGGCGNFINAQYKLNDFWTLHLISGSEIKAQESTQKIPALQFDVAQKEVHGYTGCNQLGGDIALKDSSLTFSKLITTKMACPADTLESPFLEALQKVKSYKIYNAQLLLMNRQDTLMIFRRAG